MENVTGVQKLKRECTNVCSLSGNSTETEKLGKYTSFLNTACGYNSCPTESPVEENNWGEWEDTGTRCTTSCGVGKRSRSRKCLKGQPGQPGCEGKG